MGRLKTHKERLDKVTQRRTDEDKEANELDTLHEIAQVPGWTGDFEKDSKLPGVQEIIRRQRIRQKI